MDLVGDIIVLTLSAITAVGFSLTARRLGRARRGASLVQAGLVVIALAAAMDLIPYLASGFEIADALSYAAYAIGLMTIAGGLLRWLPLLRRIDEEAERRARAEAELQDALERARSFNAGLEQLARSHIAEGWDRATLAEEAVRRVSQLAGAARVSVWRLDASGSALECETLFDVRTNAHSHAMRVTRASNPAYFEAIESGRVINVEDARTDPVTAAFTAGYLDPNGVGALLDAPILTGSTVRGVVCVEHVGGPRRFSPEDVSLASAVAQYLAVADLAGNAETLAGELKQALKAAEAASEAKSAFLANMSHELRTPLNGVVGMAEALAAGDLTADQADKADIIARSGRHLLAMLNDVLDLSRIEAGALLLTPEATNPCAVVAEVCGLFRVSAEQKGLSLTCACEALPATVRTDPVRLRQILTNLVANAVKFTDAGAVRVETEAERLEDGAWRLTFAVIDSGCGVSPAQQARLFERFSQADNSLSREHGGAGLGLVIARELARAMGGDITLASWPGEGSTFTVSIRAEADDADAAVEAAPEDGGALAGARVLIVDDNEVNRLVARCFVEPQGASVTEADSGQAAIEAFADRPFDLVLLDVHMPGLGGLETLQRLRALPGGHAPVIAITADAFSEDAARYRAAGMDGYVSKPVDRQVLVAACCDQLERARGRAVRSA